MNQRDASAFVSKVAQLLAAAADEPNQLSKLTSPTGVSGPEGEGSTSLLDSSELRAKADEVKALRLKVSIAEIFASKHQVQVVPGLGVMLSLEPGERRIDLLTEVRDFCKSEHSRELFTNDALDRWVEAWPKLTARVTQKTPIGVSVPVPETGGLDWDGSYDYLQARKREMPHDLDLLTACVVGFGATGENLFGGYMVRGRDGGAISWPNGLLRYSTGTDHLANPTVVACSYLSREWTPPDAYKLNG